MLLARHRHQTEAPIQPGPAMNPLPSDVPVWKGTPPPVASSSRPPSPATERPPTANIDSAGGETLQAAPVAAVPLLVRTPDRSPGYVEADGEIELALGRWQRALLSNDAAAITPSYAQKIERYFLQSGVTRSYVGSYLKTEEGRGSRLVSYDLSQVAIEHVGHNAVDVHFVAGFRVKTPAGEKTGNTRTLLKMHREEGDWKIYYERDYSG